MYGIYQVRELDTLASVAQEVGITLDELKKLNGITMDMNLTPGSFLIVPQYNTTYEKYIVVAGDNAYAIAKKYGVDYKTLLKLNGLDEGDYIYPGETLLIPRSGNAYVTDEETLESIAFKLNKTPAEIASLNPKMVVVENQVIRIM